ncbi:ATP-binding cassette domain-containing protein [Xanthovirga aplysinae]|uniref:ATP-binding cassette domain-containing protein n=1 Tax=Xanthovirga aplysinae TaxID=2529853 RepID=UPI0012BBC1B2|nr:ATP-binding cassette domain-containing protein [Xanthovirga aplysinae]MTI32554.1 ATP-binding cassette domain-containing protein [Xanthovirga aplysinae]
MIKHELEVDSVILNFGERQILNDVYLKCSTNEIIGLLGRNGCGKSSLLKIIFGTQFTYDKNIRIDKKPYDRPCLKGNLVAYLPQHEFLPQSTSIKKIIEMFIRNRQKRINLIEDEVIHKHLDKKVYELSGGELKYLEVLLLFSLDVKFVLLDEPFSGLSPLHKDKIKALLNANKHEKGVIITDHDYRNILEVSDRIFLINDGACKPIQNPQELEILYVPEGTFSK